MIAFIAGFAVGGLVVWGVYALHLQPKLAAERDALEQRLMVALGQKPQ